MAISILSVLGWKITVFENILISLLLVPIVAKTPLFTALIFRETFFAYHPIEKQSPRSFDFNIEPITRATLRRLLQVFGIGFIFIILITVPQLFSGTFLFIQRLAQFFLVTSGVSVFVSVFCLLPLMSRFAYSAQRFGPRPEFVLSTTVQTRRSKHSNLSSASPFSANSPKSSSTSSGGPPSSSNSSAADEPGPRKAFEKRENIIRGSATTKQNRKSGEFSSNNIFSSRSNGHIPRALEHLIDHSPGQSSQIWVPRFPKAGPALEDFRILRSPSPSDTTPSPLYPTAGKPNVAKSMSTSWSAASASLGLYALQQLENEVRAPRHAPLVAATSIGQNSFADPTTSTSTSNSFNNRAALVREVHNNLIFSPSYHTIGSSSNNFKLPPIIGRKGSMSSNSRTSGSETITP